MLLILILLPSSNILTAIIVNAGAAIAAVAVRKVIGEVTFTSGIAGIDGAVE